MIYYYIVFVLALVFGFIYSQSSCRFCYANTLGGINTKQIKKVHVVKKRYIFAVLLLCFLLIGLRNITVGADTYAYVHSYFDLVKTQGIVLNGSPEIVLNIIAWISSRFAGDYQLFLLLYSLIVVSLFGYFIYKNSNNLVISLIVFLGMFFVQSMNLMREWLAIGFGINAYYFLTKKRKFLSIIFLVLSVLSHITAVCLVFMLLIHFIKNKKRLFIVMLAISFGVFLFKNQIIGRVVALVPRYSGYASQDMFLNSGEFNIKDLIFIAVELFYIFTLFYKPYLSKDQKKIILVFASFNLIAITLSLCGGTFGIMHRLVYYYSIFLIISLPYVISLYTEKKLIYVLLIAAMFIMLYRNSVSDNNVISQYHFFWEEIPVAG